MHKDIEKETVDPAAVEKENIKRLVSLAQNGDQNAFSELLSIYDPLISATVSKFTLSNMNDPDTEDLRQEAVLAFYSSLVSYDPNISEVEFGLYAKICICNRLVSYTRILKRHMSYSISLSCDPDELIANLVEYEDPAARIIELENERSLLNLINDNLSPYERKIFKMYVAGDSNTAMASKLNTSEKSVSNAVYRIRKKLKSVLMK
jgi:RNA polymerase sporulation-specific sigma factor